MDIALVLMASGAGRRFGGNKLLAQVEGVPLIRRVMAACPPGDFHTAVVVSRYPEILALAGEQGYRPVLNTGAAEGISSSIRLGIASAGDADGILFSVCDQPWLTRESVRRLCEAFCRRSDRIVALSAGGKRGNPCLFPRSLFPELLRLTGDTGGGAVIRAHPERLQLIEAGEEKELWDIDTPEDLK